jgi:ABC-type sulfate transport system permease subunit
MSERQATPAARPYLRDPVGALIFGAGAFVTLSGVAFPTLRWMLAFGIIVVVFGSISIWSHAGP